MLPAQFTLGPMTFHLYGLIIGLAVMAAAQVAATIYKRHGGKEKQIWGAFGWALIGGIFGSRLYHVIDQWSFYALNPRLIVAVWNGGLGIWGAILGGLVGIGLYTLTLRDRKLGGKLVDAAAMGVPLGQAIGRWGNYVNQELYGKLTSLPWGLTIRNLPGRYHPLFFYESILSLILFGIMLVLERKKKFKFGMGRYLGVYLIGYATTRLLLEPLRIEMWRVMEIPVASLISIIMIGGGLWLVLKKRSF